MTFDLLRYKEILQLQKSFNNVIYSVLEKWYNDNYPNKDGCIEQWLYSFDTMNSKDGDLLISINVKDDESDEMDEGMFFCDLNENEFLEIMNKYEN